jgi:hypothetical protein
MKRQTVIPKQQDGRTEIFKNVSLGDFLIGFPFVGLGFGTYHFIGLFMNDIWTQLSYAILPVAIWIGIIFFHPVPSRRNIRLQHYLWDWGKFKTRSKRYEYMKDVDNVFNKTVQKDSTQSFVPVKKIAFEVYEAKDSRLIGGLKVQTINLSLENDENETRVLENFEQKYIKNLDFDVQHTIVAEAIDLKQYRNKLVEKFETIENPIQKRLMASYVDYVQEKEMNKNLVRKQRYIFVSEPFNPTDEKDKIRARQEVSTRLERLENMVSELPVRSKLKAVRCTNEDLKHSLRLFLEYEYSFLDHTVSDSYSELIVGRKSFLDSVKEIERNA